MKQRLIVLSFIALSSLAIADDPPQLGEARAASGIPTTARFFGGATTDDGLSYTNSVDPTTPVDIVGLVRVESTHINTVGNIYIVVQLGESFFFRNEEGNFLPWDLKLENLKAAKAEKKLIYNEPVIILDNITLGAGGLSGQTFYVYLAYDSIAALGDLFYSGSPISISVNSDEPVDPDENSDNSAPNEYPVSSIIGGDRTLADSNGIEGEPVSFSGTASDSDGSILSTEWLVGGSVVATGTNATISLPDGSTVITFRATDNEGATAEQSIIVTVSAPVVQNASPTTNISGGNRSISDTDSSSGELVSVSGTASDSDGSILSTEWLVGGSVVATGTNATISLPDGSTVITFRATDNEGATAEKSIIVTVSAPSSSSSSMNIFTASISGQIVQARCVNCHGGIAALRLVRSSVSDYANINYNSMVNYIRGGGSSSILSKPQGIGHGGGVQLSAGSTDLNNFKQFVDAVLSE